MLLLARVQIYYKNIEEKLYIEFPELKKKNITFLANRNVNNMSFMFQQCKELKYLELSNFNTMNVTNMEGMFNQCHKLKEIKGINNFNTINVTNMKAMFGNCKEIESLDLSNFDTSNVIDV